MHQKIPVHGPVLVRRARTLLISVTVLWGLSFPLMRGLELVQNAYAPEVEAAPLALADVAMRFSLAALIMLPFCLRDVLSITRQEWLQASGLAFFAGTGMALQTLGLAWTDASVAAFLTQLYTLIVPLIVAIRDWRAPTLRTFVACALVLAGAAMLSPDLVQHFKLGRGELVIFISVFFLAGQIVWVERPIFAANRALLVTVVMFALMGLMFVVGFIFTGGTGGNVVRMFTPAPAWQLSLAALFLCTVFTFLVMNQYQRHVSATEAGVIYCIEPVVAAILAGFLPGWISWFAGVHWADEALTWKLLVGGALILGATMLVATEKRAAG